MTTKKRERGRLTTEDKEALDQIVAALAEHRSGTSVHEVQIGTRNITPRQIRASLARVGAKLFSSRAVGLYRIEPATKKGKR